MNDEKGKTIQKLDQIMKLSLPYCTSEDPKLSKVFYKINNLAYDIQKHLKLLDDGKN